MRWFKDEEFLRSKVPMTKYDIRVLALSLFDLEKNKELLEIGTGTGSVTCQLAEMGYRVTGIEIKREASALTEANLKKFGLKADIITGKAPDNLMDKSFQGCFIGGMRGEIVPIFDYLDKNLKGLLVATFIKMDNLYQVRFEMKKRNYKNISTKLVWVGLEDEIGLLKAQNPIFILRGEKYD